ncbi:MAG: SIMPL domain-containing protein [Thermosynechococcaceae cyanobacterium]
MQQQRLALRRRLLAIALCSVGFSGGLWVAPTFLLAQDRPFPQSLPSPMLHTLTVTGQSSEKITATLADVQLGVEAQGKTAKQVQAEVAQRSAAVVALLKSRNVLKLQTTGINLSPQYDYNNGKQTLNGYQASNVVSFRVPTEQAGTLLDDAVQAGASRIDSVSFAASDAAIAEAQKVALRKAAQDAQEQAKAVLMSLGLSAKEIVSIQLNGANVPPPSPYPVAALKARVASADVASTPVEGGEQSIQASVTLQISY